MTHRLAGSPAQRRLSALLARRANATLAALGVALLATPAVHAATLVSYDDFSGGAISAYKWQGEEGKQYGGTRVEARRVVASGQLRLEEKGYSDNYGNVGSSTTRNSLIFTRSESITAMSAAVTMRTATAQPCAANTTPSVARARLFGFFFNSGYPTAGSEYGDVYASIQTYRASNSSDAAGVMQISASVGVCSDDECINTTTLGSVSLGTGALNTASNLQVVWDKTNKQFTFQVNSNSPVSIPYTVSDLQPPEYNAKRIEVSNVHAQCTGVRVSSYSGADFDNVMTNALPAQITNSMPAAPAARANAVVQSDPINGGGN